MKYLVFGAMLMLLFGCGGDGFEAGKAFLGTGNHEKAIESFTESIAEGHRVGEAHYEIGRLLMSEPERLPLAVWHFRMAKATYQGTEGKMEEIESGLHDVERALFDELLSHYGKEARNEMRLKVDLLEEHARKQSLWLDELRRENALLRAELGERK